MKSTILPLLLLLATIAHGGGTAPETYKLAEGRVNFSVPVGWVKINADGQRAVAFQIPNPADEGTPDSANAVVAVNPKVSGSLAESVSRLTGSLTVVTRLPHHASDKDALLLSRGQQGTTPYIVADRFARRGTIEVHVRVAWPILRLSAPDWQSSLIAEANRLMSETSVDGKFLGRVGGLVEHNHGHDGEAVRVVEAEE